MAQWRSAAIAADLLVDALTMVNALARQPQQHMSALTAPARESLPAYILPEGYIDYRIVRGLFLELLKNCSLHGLSGGSGVVPVTIAMRLDPSGGAKRLVVAITSPTTDKKWRQEESIAVPEGGLRRKSFLLRLVEFCRRSKWLTVRSSVTGHDDEWKYTTELSLDQVSVRVEGAEPRIIWPHEGE
jgi:hypothetical protein